MILNYANLPYEEIHPKWPDYKQVAGRGLPVVEFPNGCMLGQSASMARFIGKKAGVSESTNMPDMAGGLPCVAMRV